MMFNKKLGPEAKDVCPMLAVPCIGERCKWFTYVMGKNPQNGAVIDAKDCAVKWLPMLLIEGSNQQRQTAAAIESFRNKNMLAASAITEAIERATEHKRVTELNAAPGATN